MGRPAVDMRGQRFGKLLVLNRTTCQNSNKNAYWNCLCDCGEIKSISRASLRKGSVKSCGCLRKDNLKTHGLSSTAEYKSWTAMKDRCTNINSEHYSKYGGRGIIICERWLNSFQNFLEDMGYRPTLSHTLERLNVDGNYCPENCVWGTKSEQAWNRTTFINNTSGFSGVTWVERDKKWSARISINGERISLGYFNSREGAIEARLEAEIKYYGKEKINGSQSDYCED